MAHHINLQDIHDTLVLVAFEAGRMIMAANPNDITQDTKMNCMMLFLLFSNFLFFSPEPLP